MDYKKLSPGEEIAKKAIEEHPELLECPCYKQKVSKEQLNMFYNTSIMYSKEHRSAEEQFIIDVIDDYTACKEHLHFSKNEIYRQQQVINWLANTLHKAQYGQTNWMYDDFSVNDFINEAIRQTHSNHKRLLESIVNIETNKTRSFKFEKYNITYDHWMYKLIDIVYINIDNVKIANEIIENTDWLSFYDNAYTPFDAFNEAMLLK